MVFISFQPIPDLSCKFQIFWEKKMLIIENWGDFFKNNDTKMTITRKIKIAKIWKLVSLSIQPISDLPCKFLKFLKKKIIFLKFWNLHGRSEISWIEKMIIFRFFQFLFFELWSFWCHFLWCHHPNFRW